MNFNTDKTVPSNRNSLPVCQQYKTHEEFRKVSRLCSVEKSEKLLIRVSSLTRLSVPQPTCTCTHKLQVRNSHTLYIQAVEIFLRE